MSDLNVLVVVASTRPGRVGLPVSRWIIDAAKQHGGFRVTVADLAEENLPLMDEPNHPRLRDYQHEHTKRWSAKVDAADAVVFVVPEYNFSLAAPLKNALDYLHAEWSHKPGGVVSYGGISAGTRSVMAMLPTAYAVKLHLLPEAVNIPFVQSLRGDDGEIIATESMQRAATTMLDELVRVATALKPLRG